MTIFRRDKARCFAAMLLLAFTITAPVQAGEADVVSAVAKQAANGTWRFDVTVSHADEGWEHYANKWEVLSEDGTVLATRVLAHPHVDEQPFTRSKSGVKIPDNINRVRVRAGDSVHGNDGKEIVLELR